MIDAAHTLLAAGFSVIPTGANKKASIPWAQYQQQRMTADEAKPKRQLTFTLASELTGFQDPTRWTIKGYIEAGTISTLFAPAESLKTFVVLDMGLCVATGKPWHGHKVEAGPVLYVCGEGRRGIGRRLQAWQKHNLTKIDHFFVSNTSTQLLDEASLAELEAAADEVALQHGTPVLMIIDTLNRNFGPGDENSTNDMTKLIAALDRLRDRLQCAVLVVHHTGLKESGRSRGNSALRGALDFEYQVVRHQGAAPEERSIELSCSKCKDHDRPPIITFQPVVVDLGLVDDDGRPITSLVLERSKIRTAKNIKSLPASQKIAMDALRSVAGKTGKAHLDTWRKKAYSMGISPSGALGAKQKAFKRAVSELLASRLVEARDDDYWPAGQARTTTGHVRQCPEGGSRTDTDICPKTMSSVRHPDTHPGQT